MTSRKPGDASAISSTACASGASRTRAPCLTRCWHDAASPEDQMVHALSAPAGGLEAGHEDAARRGAWLRHDPSRRPWRPQVGRALSPAGGQKARRPTGGRRPGQRRAPERTVALRHRLSPGCRRRAAAGRGRTATPPPLSRSVRDLRSPLRLRVPRAARLVLPLRHGPPGPERPGLSTALRHRGRALRRLCRRHLHGGLVRARPRALSARHLPAPRRVLRPVRFPPGRRAVPHGRAGRLRLGPPAGGRLCSGRAHQRNALGAGRRWPRPGPRLRL